jgi:hypothetical protein
MAMRSFMEGMGYPGFTAEGPERQFYEYGLGAFRPGYTRGREAFYQAQNPLMAQYNLAEPLMNLTSGGTSFGDFMGLMEGATKPVGEGYAAYNPYGANRWGNVMGLRDRAEQAAFMSGLTQNEADALYLASQNLGTDPAAYAALSPTAQNELWGAYTIGDDPGFTQAQWDQYAAMQDPTSALYRTTFGTGGEEVFQTPAEAQAQLVQLMALQRTETPGGETMYGAGSRYGRALMQQLAGAQRQLEATSPDTNFLDWYLARTGEGFGAPGS